MNLRCKLSASILSLLASTLVAGMLPAVAESDILKQGYSEYNSGNYNDALGHLQGALSTEFNNAKLHYYLANTYIHLNLKDSGIREFRIAYALEPEKEVGKLSKQALQYLGAEGETPKPKETKELDKKPPSDPLLDKITATLQQQAEHDKGLNRTNGDSIYKDFARRTSEQLDKTKSDLQRDSSYYRRGRLIQLPLPDDALKQLDSLKQMYDAQKGAYNDGTARHSDEIQKSADNLTGLLNERGKAGSPHLVPAGTNLYIRNYNTVPGTTPAAAASSTAATSPPTASPPPPSSAPPSGSPPKSAGSPK